MSLLRIGCLLVCCLCAPLLCRAEQLHVYCDDWPGFCQQDGKGFYLELANIIYRPHGYTIVAHIVPYKRAIAMVAHRNGDMTFGVYQDENDNVQTPEYPDSADDLTVLMLKQWQASWLGEKSLTEQQVIWPRGWALDQYLPVAMQWHEVESEEKAIELLEKGRYRYYLTVGILHANSEPPANMYRAFLRWIPTYPAFSNNERGGKLRQIWDQEMVRIIRNGELSKLYQRHQLYDYYQKFIKEMEQKARR